MGVHKNCVAVNKRRSFATACAPLCGLYAGQRVTQPPLTTDALVAKACDPCAQSIGLGSSPNGGLIPGVEKFAGESTGAFAAPVRSQPPAVRAGERIYGGF